MGTVRREYCSFLSGNPITHYLLVPLPDNFLPSCPVSRGVQLLSLNPLSFSQGETTLPIYSLFSSLTQQSLSVEFSFSSPVSFICRDSAIVIFLIASFEIFFSVSSPFSYSDHLGEAVTDDSGSRFGKNPFVKNSSERISFIEGLLAGFACSIFWMSLAALSDIREGIVYSLFLILL